MASVNSVDPDQLAHMCHMIKIYTVRFLIYLVISDQIANSADLDQMEQMFRLIWIYTVCSCEKRRIDVYGGKGYGDEICCFLLSALKHIIITFPHILS
jgi:hypothetical protein